MNSNRLVVAAWLIAISLRSYQDMKVIKDLELPVRLVKITLGYTMLLAIGEFIDGRFAGVLAVGFLLVQLSPNLAAGKLASTPQKGSLKPKTGAGLLNQLQGQGKIS